MGFIKFIFWYLSDFVLYLLLLNHSESLVALILKRYCLLIFINTHPFYNIKYRIQDFYFIILTYHITHNCVMRLAFIHHVHNVNLSFYIVIFYRIHVMEPSFIVMYRGQDKDVQVDICIFQHRILTVQNVFYFSRYELFKNTQQVLICLSTIVSDIIEKYITFIFQFLIVLQIDLIYIVI